jgi:hypothetical protein
MDRHFRFVSIFGCAAMIALAGCATSGSVAPASGPSALSHAQRAGRDGPEWIHAGNIVYHVPKYLATRSSGRPAVSGIQISYRGGPVLVNPKTYLILWGYKKYGDPDGVAKLLRQYLKVEGGSGHNNVYTQYYEIVSGQKIYITNPKGQSGGIWDDEKDAVAPYPTDAQVATEALAGVSHFGYDAGGSYIVATPHGRSSQGFGVQWCAYHSATYDAGKLISYTNLPYMPDAGTKTCGADAIKAPKDESPIDEGVTIVEGDEYGDSITDPIPGTGWYGYVYGEIDLCSGLHNDKFGKKRYATKAMYSDNSSGGSCVQTN